MREIRREGGRKERRKETRKEGRKCLLLPSQEISFSNKNKFSMVQ
jgi:hypothetical protein